MTAAIEVQSVSVSYRVPVAGGRRTLKALPLELLGGRGQRRRIDALRDVSLALEPGEAIGLIGHNGAGKSTLLRLLARVFRPDSGRVVVRGTVAPLVDLGGGLDINATGRDNVLLYGALLGRRLATLRAEADGILDWAGLSAYADVPVYAYSSGMTSRLAFAIATAARPDILLVDEVLAVGDADFQQRREARIDELLSGGTTVVIASHALEQIRALTPRAIWLDHGQVRADGTFDDVVSAYAATAAEPGASAA